MRNLVAHPVTRKEIVECLRQLSSELWQMDVNDMRPILLEIAAHTIDDPGVNLVNILIDNAKQKGK